MADVTVRWFAAAGEAAGRSQDRAAADGSTTGELLGRLVAERGERLGQVLEVCSVLVDGEVDPDRSLVLVPGATVDVLPPFAGG